jgi:very-short-patch-repair endonuclease
MNQKELPESVKRTIDAVTQQQRSELEDAAFGCQSPIEQMLAVALEKSYWGRNITRRECALRIKIIEIRPQEPQEMKSGNTYIPDFTIPVWDKVESCGKMFAIECDGHEFHEKTKEQVRHDRARERELIEDGYTVIRFSGSEIYDDPFKCASDVFKIIFSYFRDKRKIKAEG